MLPIYEKEFKTGDRVILPTGRTGVVMGQGNEGRICVNYTVDGNMSKEVVDIWGKYLRLDSSIVDNLPKGMLQCAQCGTEFKRRSASNKYCTKECKRKAEYHRKLSWRHS